jgi:hypothetical protein
LAEYVEKPVQQLIGDFYEAHAKGDEEGMRYPLEKLKGMIFTGELKSEPFIEYYNSMFSGRTAFNALISVNDYPFESIFRELLQNTFDCYYDTKDVKIMVNFRDNDEISLSYNEIGFQMDHFLYYLAFGRNKLDKNKEGRFGVGAKSVFMNVEWLSMHSRNFSFKIQNNGGTLKITELNLLGSLFKGTEIVVKVSSEQYARIKDNFLTLADKKGDFINLVELCFAFNRKKVMNAPEANFEEPERTFNIAVMERGRIVTLYKIAYFQKDDSDMKTIRFMQNNKSVVDFIAHEQDGFSYLIPFAVATAKRQSIVKVFLQKYNFFSTYELTGLIKADAAEKIIDEKLSAFFISVSNDYITSFRTGIRVDSEHVVMQKVEQGIKDLIENYKDYFILDLQPIPEEENRWMFRPKSYAFEFIKNFILTSKMASNLKNNFQESISINFPNEPAPVGYAELKETAFSVAKSGITEEAHRNGSAYGKYIQKERDNMVDKLTQYAVKTIYLSYNWESQDGTGGRQFYYEFIRENKTYIIENKTKAGLADYNLYVHFNSMVSLMLDRFVGKDNLIEDEDALESMLTFFDDAYNEDYKIHMRYYQLYISHGEEQYTVDISKMKINNIKNAMEAVLNRRHRFDTSQAYNETSKMILNVFTQGKETIEFLKEMKAQGGQITLALDINKKYRFSAYGNQFLIPGKTTNAQMLEIIGDMGMLIAAGMLNGRKFDFPYSRGRYSFDKNAVYNLLKSDKISVDYVGETLAKIYACDLKVDRIALIGEGDKIIDIVDAKTPINEKYQKDITKYIILRDDFTKPETADIIEMIITGENNGAVAKSFVKFTEPNIVIPDQMPYYNKALPTISREEFNYLRAGCKNLDKLKNQKAYKNYFAKDVNSKLFGYGGCCPVCGVETETVNSFTVKEFEVELLAGDRERVFVTTLYMCANDFFAADGWIIEDISVGGMPPFMWVEEISAADVIYPEFLHCSMRLSTQVSFDVPARDKVAVRDGITAAGRMVDFVLTPLMAAKWAEDNATPPSEEEFAPEGSVSDNIKSA